MAPTVGAMLIECQDDFFVGGEGLNCVALIGVEVDWEDGTAMWAHYRAALIDHLQDTYRTAKMREAAVAAGEAVAATRGRGGGGRPSGRVVGGDPTADAALDPFRRR